MALFLRFLLSLFFPNQSAMKNSPFFCFHIRESRAILGKGSGILCRGKYLILANVPIPGPKKQMHHGTKQR